MQQKLTESSLKPEQLDQYQTLSKFEQQKIRSLQVIGLSFKEALDVLWLQKDKCHLN